MQSNKRKRYQKDSAPTDDIITLIQLVRQNPALYNYKLQPNQRRRIDVHNGWAHIAAQIGNKYTVEECRRKWKNLRDTFHQYRLRKPKLAHGNAHGLDKWRYAKELDFLANVYQPKLKAHRQQSFHDVTHDSLLHAVHENLTDENGTVDMVHGHSGITLVNHDAETFILTAYEESVNDVSHEDPSMAADLNDVDGEDVVQIIKNEHTTSLDVDDDVADAEVDYEEVCLYEEAANGPSEDCETIVSVSADGGRTGSMSPDSKRFEYIDTNDFCINTINAQTSLPISVASNGVISTSKLKNITVLATNSSSNVMNRHTTSVAATVTATTTMPTGATATISLPLAQSQTSVGSVAACGQTREELDLFFDFLKKKMQRFAKEEITAIQVEFLNCVLRREAESALKGN